MDNLSFEERLEEIVRGEHQRPRPFYCVQENGTVESSHEAWLDAKAADDPKDK